LKNSRLCEPNCPYFKCGQKAIYVKRGQKQGEKIIYCNWIGDLCIGAKCRYAFCEKKVLLPDGSCGLEEKPRKVRSIEEEALKEEIILKSVQMLLKKKGMEFIE
jgi:hypothetical protein